MTKTLTEQWRKGKLAEGLYYIEGKGDYDIALIRNRYCPVLTSPYCEDNVFESEFVPIAPVPSYEEYQQLVSNSDKLSRKTLQLKKKLAIATKALKKYQEAINRFKKDPMNNIIMLAHQLIYDIDIDSKKALKEMEGVK